MTVQIVMGTLPSDLTVLPPYDLKVVARMTTFLPLRAWRSTFYQRVDLERSRFLVGS